MEVVPAVDDQQIDNIVDTVVLLDATEDKFEGVTVDMTKKEAMDSTVFSTLLRASLFHWRRQGKKGVWIKLPIKLANLVEAAVEEGFWYHHAEPTYLMLVYWIPGTDPTIPSNASHQVGVSAFVMNNSGEVLVVQENSGRFKGTGVWKFPTGVVNEGEDVCAAAIREVKEETRIETEFVELLAIRQSHKAFFGKSDLLFVCMLNPLSFDIQKQDSEIQAAKWMPFKEFAAQPFMLKHEVFKYIAKVCSAKIENGYTGFSAVPTTSASSGKKSYLYFNNQNLGAVENI